jgi:hypothetical protein
MVVKLRTFRRKNIINQAKSVFFLQISPNCNRVGGISGKCTKLTGHGIIGRFMRLHFSAFAYPVDITGPVSEASRQRRVQKNYQKLQKKRAKI